MLSTSKTLSESDLAIEDKSKRKIKRKQKNLEYREPIEGSLNFITSDLAKPSPSKKRKKGVSVDVDQYKPGMLSDFLQNQKYGCLILPWEASFGMKISHESGHISDGGTSEHKPKLKINPLFDTSKMNEGNFISKNCATYTVFVGNLPQEVTVNRVKKIFKKFGNTINKIKLRSEERGKKKVNGNNQNSNVTKHAIVKFNSLESYKTALKLNGKLFDGYHLRITGAEGKTASDQDKSIFVGNLPSGVNDDLLWKTFEDCGEIDSVRVIRDKVNKKGIFGYVNFQSAEAVDGALKFNGTLLLDREIRVSRINKNIDSLSNSVNVKRIKKKKAKHNLNDSAKEIESDETLKLNGTNLKRNKKKKGKHDLNGSAKEIESDETLKLNGTNLKRNKKKKAKHNPNDSSKVIESDKSSSIFEEKQKTTPKSSKHTPNFQEESLSDIPIKKKKKKSARLEEEKISDAE